jgi:hypothetical protein
MMMNNNITWCANCGKRSDNKHKYNIYQITYKNKQIYTCEDCDPNTPIEPYRSTPGQLSIHFKTDPVLSDLPIILFYKKNRIQELKTKGRSYGTLQKTKKKEKVTNPSGW